MLGTNILLLLTDTLLSVYAFFVVLRCVFMLSGVNFYHPFVQAVVRLTQTPVLFLRVVAPIVWRIDLAAWLLAVLIKVLQLALIFMIQGGSPPDLPNLISMAVIQTAIVALYIYIFAIFILAVSSWFVSSAQAINHPFIALVNGVSAPLLIFIRRFIPTSGVIDFSPMIALLGLYIVLMTLKSLIH